MGTNYSCSLNNVKKYLETLRDSVELLLSSGPNPNDLDLLLRLKVMLKSDAVPVFMDNLTCRKLNLPALRKIQEIDDALDELYIRGCKLAYPDESLLIKTRKNERTQRITVLILLLGLLGFEWVS